MSAAGSPASSMLSLWSDAVINRVTPTAAAPASSKLNTALRDMMGSSKKETGVECHLLYARARRSDWRPLTAARQGADEERLLRGLGRAAGGLFRHGTDFGLHAGRHLQRDDGAAAGRRVERAHAHRRAAFLDRPDLIGPARRRGRQVERSDDDDVARAVPVEPHGRRFAGGGEIRD